MWNNCAFFAVHVDACLLAVLLLVINAEYYAAYNNNYAEYDYAIDHAAVALFLEIITCFLIILIMCI